MTQRYYLSTPPEGDSAKLSDGEARHLIQVMRVAVADEVLLFDGTGVEYVARVEQLGRGSVRLAIVERRAVERELPACLTLGVALPKGDRQRWLVEKAVELGAARLVPLIAERGVARPAATTLERLRRTVIEACKQCGRNRLMEIADPIASGKWFSAPNAAGSAGEHRWLADPGGRPLGSVLAMLSRDQQSTGEIRLAVGPEGGFTADELALAAQSGWQTVSLGSRRTLRVETAAVALVAAVAAWLEFAEG